MADHVRREQHVRNVIIEHAQAVYGSQYPQIQRFSEAQRWSVIVGKSSEGRYKAHVIVYEQLGSLGRWKVLKSSEKERGPERALNSLLEEMMGEVGKMLVL